MVSWNLRSVGSTSSSGPPRNSSTSVCVGAKQRVSQSSGRDYMHQFERGGDTDDEWRGGDAALVGCLRLVGNAVCRSGVGCRRGHGCWVGGWSASCLMYGVEQQVTPLWLKRLEMVKREDCKVPISANVILRPLAAA